MIRLKAALGNSKRASLDTITSLVGKAVRKAWLLWNCVSQVGNIIMFSAHSFRIKNEPCSTLMVFTCVYSSLDPNIVVACPCQWAIIDLTPLANIISSGKNQMINIPDWTGSIWAQIIYRGGSCHQRIACFHEPEPWFLKVVEPQACSALQKTHPLQCCVNSYNFLVSGRGRGSYTCCPEQQKGCKYHWNLIKNKT